jgi:hypothetical protein
MVWQFIQYWLHNCSIGLHFGNGIFKYISEICVLISAGLFLFKKCYQQKWEQWEQIIMKTAFYLFIISFLVATFLVAPFLESESDKSKLKDASSSQQQTANIKTKQDIRTFLEAINPQILKKIDVGELVIPILIGWKAHIRLQTLSGYPDFGKFLSYHKAEGYELKMDNYIKELNDDFLEEKYIFNPKDALIK